MTDLLPKPPDSKLDTTTAVRKLQCFQCPSSFNSTKNLSLHEATHSTTSPYICPECGRKVVRLASFKAHIQTHEEDDSISCPLCDDDFATENDLNVHLTIRHNDTSEFAGAESPSKSFKCKSCPKEFQTKQDSINHKLEHLKIRQLLKRKHKRANNRIKERIFPNKCTFCPKTFKKPSQCLRHERIHTGEKPFKCSDCGKEFNQKNSLDIHMRGHLGQKPYHCQICNASFAQNGNLRTHVLRVHSVALSSDNVHRCKDCPCSFKTIGGLHTHIRRYHSLKENRENKKEEEKNDQEANNPPKEEVIDKKPGLRKQILRITTNSNAFPSFSCENCGDSFKKPSDLCRHISSVHEAIQTQSYPPNTQSFSSQSLLKDHQTTQSPSQTNLFKKIPLDQAENNKNSVDIEGQLNVYSQMTSEAKKANESSISISDNGVISFNPSDIALDISEFQLTPSYNNIFEDLNNRAQGGLAVGAKEASSKEVANENSVSEMGLEPSRSSFNKSDRLTEGSLSERVYQESLAESKSQAEESANSKENTSKKRRNENSCPHCSKLFRKPSDLARHIRTHTGEKPFVCNLCNRGFALKATLEDHLKTHAPESEREKIPCHLCHLKFSKKAALKVHMRLHTGALPYKCFSCDQCFRTPFQRKSHMNSLHSMDAKRDKEPEDSAKESRTNDNTMLQVTLPSSSLVSAFMSLSETGVPLIGSTVKLQLHGTDLEDTEVILLVDQVVLNQVERGEDVTIAIDVSRDVNFVSSVNDNQDEETSEITAQIDQQVLSPKIESGVASVNASSKEFACTCCNSVFKKKSLLTRHMRIHTGERPYGCDTCGKRFNQTNALKMHQRKHSGLRPFICPFCSYAFTQKCNLKMHIQRAHESEAQILLEKSFGIAANPS